jgi:hypothetical protein
MSFWCIKFSKKPTKNLTNFCPRSQINKVKALSYNTMIIWAIYVLKTLYGAVILWFDHFLDSGQKFVKFFVGFLENLKTTSKRYSEIIWPLAGA